MDKGALRHLWLWLRHHRKKCWVTFIRDEPNGGRYVAVWPNRDLIAHGKFDEDCVCGPKVTLVTCCENCPDSWMITHEALDGRP